MSHRDDLLAAARTLLERKGYAHITTRDLVAESGTNLGSIAYHFGSKAGLLNEAIGAAFEEWTEQLARIAMADPDAGLAERGLSAWDAMLDDLTTRRAVLVAYLDALAQAERTPELRDQFAGQYRRCRARVAALVAESLADGTRPEDPRARTLAAFVIAVCDGLSVQWLLDPDGAPTSAELADGLAVLWASAPSPRGQSADVST
ncbi:TetR/AcrR family transcriptional regulator [Saccharomonospora saliphila]|uniref:TetR/AcrR family transcriptional regulator n=1 Tax=Saccharomonospora saliphila TaxID=369829 RepID=UPI00036FD447|nr:TetR/AcrR family transcriptional regulator [Saccharomonospora saliphila]